MNRGTNRRALRFEQLEVRRLLTATDWGSFSFDEGELRIQIEVQDPWSIHADSTVKVVAGDSQNQSLDILADDVKRIVIHGHNGNDDVALNVAHFTHIEQIEINLGQGDDQLVIHSLDSAAPTVAVSLGEGNDHLEITTPLQTQADLGSGADVAVVASDSEDTRLFGADGSDSLTLLGIGTVLGGRGDDLIMGNSANNHLFGEEGNDIIWAFGGDDVVVGGFGNDLLILGAGSDVG